MIEKITSPVVYREIRNVFQPWCRESGFRRTTSRRAEWYREHAPEIRGHWFLTFWFQVSSWGNHFTAEFQLADEPRMSLAGRERIGFVFDDSTRLAVLEREAEIRTRTTGETVEPWERSRPSDLWFSYGDADDVAEWAKFLLPLWPGLLERFVTSRV